ncbi:MAG: hypothetical protein A4E53_00388 [Pelotomaculum sp. PtaB.Bin104]|nr:MAG: hypothetical protein A4E53_00388 [Pelotomaculum sp. PtaB.Bin104]
MQVNLRRISLIISIVFLTIVIAAVIYGCNSKGAYYYPPLADTFYQSVNKGLKTNDFISGLVAYRYNDVAELKRISSISNKDQRKKEAFDQWLKLWEVYLEWKSKGEKLNSSGMVIFGPVASCWLNEIQLSLQARQILATETNSTLDCYLQDVYSLIKKEQFYDRNKIWLNLGGLNTTNDWISIATDAEIPKDIDVIKNVENTLNSSSYPFANGLFEDNIVYVIPGETLHLKETEGYNQCGGTMVMEGFNRRYTPDATIFDNPRIILPVVKASKYLGHELGHAWTFNNYDKLHRKEVIKDYYDTRGGLVPQDFNNIDFNDVTSKLDRLVAEEEVQLGYVNDILENIAEDFAKLFFTTDYVRKGTWPDLDIMQSTIKANLTDNVFKAYSHPSGCPVRLNPIPIISKDNINIVGYTKPGAVVKLLGLKGNEVGKAVARDDGMFIIDLLKDADHPYGIKYSGCVIDVRDGTNEPVRKTIIFYT